MCPKLVQTATATILANSSRQAMDWALVLASQSIECAIEHDSERGEWLVAVAETDRDRAAESIRAYEQENATGWRQELKWTGLLFDWRSVFWWAFVICIFVFGEMRSEAFVQSGAFPQTQRCKSRTPTRTRSANQIAGQST